jgi:hypothetical protein
MLARNSQRFSEFRLPKGVAVRKVLALAIGADALTVLEAVLTADTPLWLR